MRMSKYHWLNEESQTMLNRGYLLQGETVEGAIKRITESAAKQLNRPDLALEFEKLIEKGWISLSSPIWANMGTERGLPISCNGVFIEDNINSIVDKYGEVIIQTKLGAGTSGYFGELRPRGASITDNGVSSGAVSFMQLFDTAMNVVSQGHRRGAFAAYLDIDHPDILEFLHIKDIGNSIQNLFTGVCVPDYWLNEMIAGDEDKRVIWAKTLQSRKEKGLPYILFSDNANRNKPKVYKDKNMRISASNLCSEIMLPSSKDESFVCCLASLNLEYFLDWKDTNTVQLLTYFLDAVMSEYIDKVKDIPYMQASYNFAVRQRAIGIGVLGMFSYFQKHMIAPESLEAKQHTTQIFKHIQEESIKASKQLALEYGEPELLKGYGLRNTTLTAIAPTTSSSAILGGVSAGIEPFSSNYYKVELAKGNFIRKNKFLKQLLIDKGQDNEDVWRSIMINGGSVQHLDVFTQHEKDVFKTFKELSQLSLIQLASIRQRYIDQSQSLNINIPHDASPKDVNTLILEAWKLGVKTLYYQRSESVSKEFLNNIVNCNSCEG